MEYDDNVWWFSPHLFSFPGRCFCFYVFKDVGEIHRRDNNYTLVLPSVTMSLFAVSFIGFKMSGRFTGEETKIITLVLPSMNRNPSFFKELDFFICAFCDLHFGVYAFVHFSHF